MKFPWLGFLVGFFLFVGVPAWAGGEPGVYLGGEFFPYTVEGTPLLMHPILLAAEPAQEKECSCWRVLGAFAGGAGGFLGYAPFAVSESRVGVSDTQRLVEWSAVTAGAAYLGYLIGRKFDRR